MKVEIISIGDELLIGQVINTNAAWIGQFFTEFGLKISKTTVVGDHFESIIKALQNAVKESDVVILTGGLGPTKDDITKKVLCSYFNSQLVFNPTIFHQVEVFLKKRGGTMNELNRSQAMIPDNSIPLPNLSGTAPGLWFQKEKKIIVSLPGVPYEMKMLMEKEVMPRLKKTFSFPSILSHTILTIGIAEAILAEKLESFENHLPPYISLAYLPSPGLVKLRLTAYGETINIKPSFEEAYQKLLNILGIYVVSTQNESIQQVIGNLLRQKNKTLSIAESCTGGNISRLITSVPGSSSYFKGSIIAYSNEIKNNFLNIPQEILNDFGAVSRQTVEKMAVGILQLFKTDYSVAVSGIAGPGGGTPDKPVGTVWIAVASKDSIHSEVFRLGDERERNIEKASIFALNLLRIKILENQD